MLRRRVAENVPRSGFTAIGLACAMAAWIIEIGSTEPIYRIRLLSNAREHTFPHLRNHRPGDASMEKRRSFRSKNKGTRHLRATPQQKLSRTVWLIDFIRPGALSSVSPGISQHDGPRLASAEAKC